MRNRKAIWITVFSALWLLLAGLPVEASGEIAHVRFQSVQAIDWALDVADDVFLQNGQSYRQDMAQASLGMALSAFRVPDVELAKRGDHIRDFLSELGFSKITLDEYDVEPSIQTIASAIAQKSLTDAGGPFTVLAVAISGGGYQDEWKSNFLIGNGLHHEGFNHAAQRVYDRLAAYIARNGVLGRIKIWMSGYSRAAATANRLGAIVLDNRLVTSENLFCYTFATPNVTRQQDAGAYPSIFNIVGSFDPVPMIPFEEWGFTRYGVTHYLPTPETDSDYSQRVAPVKDMYRWMTGSEYWTNQSDNRLVTKMFGVLTDMVSNIDDYAKHYQGLLIDLWNRKSDPLSMVTGLVQTLSSDQSLWEQVSAQADKALAIVSNAAGEALLQDVGLFTQQWRMDTGLTENLMHEHYPKGYLAWLFAYRNVDDMVSRNNRYRQILIGGDVGLSIYDENERQVSAFDLDDGLLVGQDGDTSLSISQSGDALSVCIPADKAYRMEIVEQESEPLDLMVREGTVGSLRMLSYQPANAELPLGVPCTFTLPVAFATDGTRYTLQWAGGEAECQAVNSSNTLDQLEVDSTAKQVLSENMVTLVGIAVMLLLECVFLLVAGLFAFRRHRRRVVLRRTLPMPALREKRFRLRFRRGQGLRNLLKGCALLLLAAAALLLEQAASTTVIWFSQTAAVEQAILFWYLTLLNIPLVFLPLLAAMPALFAALLALLWPEDSVDRLKTSRTLTVFAIPYTAVLLYVLYSDLYRSFQAWLLAGAYAQVGLLVLQCVLSFIILHRHARRAKAHRELGAGAVADEGADVGAAVCETAEAELGAGTRASSDDGAGAEVDVGV